MRDYLFGPQLGLFLGLTGGSVEERSNQRHLPCLIQTIVSMYLSALENGGESLCPDRMTTRRHKSAKVSWLWNMSLGIPFNFSGQGLCESIRDWLGIWFLVLLAVDPGDFCDQL